MVQSIWARALAFVAAAIATTALHSHAQHTTTNVPKQVHLVLDGNRILASNVRLNRFDELKLGAQERIQKQQVGQAVAIVVTNQRIIAYGVLSGWVPMDRVANETIHFNGETGIWAEQKRRVSR
jgi:hypothetical protein